MKLIAFIFMANSYNSQTWQWNMKLDTYISQTIENNLMLLNIFVFFEAIYYKELSAYSYSFIFNYPEVFFCQSNVAIPNTIFCY